jgi:serine/threonine-protein phosphatase 2A regulatory subunit A
MQNMKNLAAVIGSDEIEKHIIPPILEMSNDKNWRVKLAIIEFIPLLCELIDKEVFKQKLEGVVLGWLADNVFQIREEAINTLMTLKDNLFDLQWLEQLLEAKMEEFYAHQRFALRIHTLFIIQKSFDKVSKEFLNEKEFSYLQKLSEDPVPNIKFTVAKTLELIYSKLTNSNKVKCKDMLTKMLGSSEDFDVKFYCEKALKAIRI